MTIEEVFSQIYHTNQWGNEETPSGPGSSIDQTKSLVENLNLLIANLRIQTVLDIPCGDFNWIRNLDLRTLQYTGADIVKDLILRNKATYETKRIQFEHRDLTKDFLPQTDLVINRDCLVHFCFNDIEKAITNIIISKSTYLLTTTFPGQTHNYDIVTGDWRPINLQLPPFDFPKPLQMITESFEAEFEKYNRGKALALWKIADLKLLPRFAKGST
jgi:SAM-dependent methyltransferase